MDKITRTGERREVRAIRTQFNTREEDGGMHISGYFAVFDGVYEIGPGMTESVDPEAFKTLWAGISALSPIMIPLLCWGARKTTR